MGPKYEIVELTQETVDYIANYLSIPVADIQAAYEYRNAQFKGEKLYFVVTWFPREGWHVVRESRLLEFYYFPNYYIPGRFNNAKTK